MSDRGYAAIVKAAAKLACSPIVDREVRERAQEFLDAEIAKAEKAADESPDQTDESDHSEDLSERILERDNDLTYTGPTNAHR